MCMSAFGSHALEMHWQDNLYALDFLRDRQQDTLDDIHHLADKFTEINAFSSHVQDEVSSQHKSLVEVLLWLNRRQIYLDWTRHQSGSSPTQLIARHMLAKRYDVPIHVRKKLLRLIHSLSQMRSLQLDLNQSSSSLAHDLLETYASYSRLENDIDVLRVNFSQSLFLTYDDARSRLFAIGDLILQNRSSKQLGVTRQKGRLASSFSITPETQNISSFVDGTIVFADRIPGVGVSIIIQNPRSGMAYLLSGFSSLCVHVGEYVHMGDSIGSLDETHGDILTSVWHLERLGKS